MKKKKWIVDILLVVLIIGLGLIIYTLINGGIFTRSGSEEIQTTDSVSVTENQVQEESQEQSSVKQTDPEIAAPEFGLMTPDGELVALTDFRGKVVIVNFWATWCPPCRAEMPIFNDFGEQYSDELVILAINSGEDAEVINSFASQFSDSIIFLVDLDTSVGDLYQVRGLPTTYFVDPQGYLQAIHIGELTESLLATYLDKLDIE